MNKYPISPVSSVRTTSVLSVRSISPYHLCSISPVHQSVPPLFHQSVGCQPESSEKLIAMDKWVARLEK